MTFTSQVRSSQKNCSASASGTVRVIICVTREADHKCVAHLAEHTGRNSVPNSLYRHSHRLAKTILLKVGTRRTSIQMSLMDRNVLRASSVPRNASLLDLLTMVLIGCTRNAGPAKERAVTGYNFSHPPMLLCGGRDRLNSTDPFVSQHNWVLVGSTVRSMIKLDVRAAERNIVNPNATSSAASFGSGISSILMSPGANVRRHRLVMPAAMQTWTGSPSSPLGRVAICLRDDEVPRSRNVRTERYGGR